MEPQEIKFSSKPENIHIVEKFINSIFDDLKISNDYYGIIYTALYEAVDNAIRHGNKSNPDKNVHLFFESTSDGLSFAVRDEGNGFNFNNIKDPTEVSETGEFNSGKGIYLIKKLADKVNFNDNGRTIETIFNVPGVNYKISSERQKNLKSFFKEKYKAIFKVS